jgi:V/A-type H+-transporting ATPase subunit E
MSYRELIDALTRESDEKVRKIWQEAEVEAERVRAETGKAVGEMRERCGLDRSSAARARADAILSEARSAARAKGLRAEEDLSGRLYDLAVRSLHHLRKEQYRDIFAVLVSELPGDQWSVVKVNPGDREISREFFQDAEIISDPGITGGLEVTGRNGKIRVVNTFEKRLQRAWPEMLPEIVKDVYREIST